MPFNASLNYLITDEKYCESPLFILAIKEINDVKLNTENGQMIELESMMGQYNF
jgi:hypothetical protein